MFKRHVTIEVKQLDKGEETIIDYTNINEGIEKYEDSNGDIAYIPENFKVSSKEDEQQINTGLVVIGPTREEEIAIRMGRFPVKLPDVKLDIFGQ